jgi:hypothetical protein
MLGVQCSANIIEPVLYRRCLDQAYAQNEETAWQPTPGLKNFFSSLPTIGQCKLDRLSMTFLQESKVGAYPNNQHFIIDKRTNLFSSLSMTKEKL